MLLSGTVAKSELSAVPSLDSYPAATARLYLDFVGDSARSWGSYNVPQTPAYDQDGDPTTFTSGELAAIREIWARVAEKYSPFNINVTTVNPATLADKRALRVVIGGDGAWVGGACGGLSYVGSFYNSDPNTSYVFSENLAGGDAKCVAEAAAHEAGHGFGLEHQSQYDTKGNLVEDYFAGDGDTAPIMGNSYDATRGLWWDGVSSSATTRQDDLSVLTSSSNGFGYRADDHGDRIASSSRLQVDGRSVSGSGVIEKTTDVDYFSFTTGAGVLNFTIDPAAFGPMLDLKVSLLKSNGTVVATANTYSLGEEFSATIAEGSYRLVVESNGLYGDVGQYTIAGIIVPVNVEKPVTPSGLAVNCKVAKQLLVTWSVVDGADQYVLERSIDGATWGVRATVAASTTSLLDAGLAVGQVYYYRVSAANDGGTSAPTAAVSGIVKTPPAPAAPSNMRVVVLAPYKLRLSWTDNSKDETGFRIQWSADGATWYLLKRAAANRKSIDISLTRRDRTYFRVNAYSQYGASRFSGVASALAGAASRKRPVKKAPAVFSPFSLRAIPGL